jgi:small-conductance mechanosensitive channel
MRRKYRVPTTELEPRVFTTPTDNYVELVARFIVPVRRARAVKDALSRDVVRHFAEAGIEIASTTSDVRLRRMNTEDDSARHTTGRDGT